MPGTGDTGTVERGLNSRLFSSWNAKLMGRRMNFLLAPPAEH